MIYFTLNQLKKGSEAVVMDLKGGYSFINKLNAMGIRKGKELIKISDSFYRGPVTVKIGQTKVAVGFGMAEKIIVKMVDSK